EKLYEDNANRSILIYLDNSKNHKEAIMNYQRSLAAGQINQSKEQEIKEFFKDIQSVLKPIKVINRYAPKLIIPETDFRPLRTNSHYLNFIEVITFYKQYQKEKKTDNNGDKYIETTLEDIKEANELLKEVLLNKSDELTKASRNFLEMIKAYLKTHKKETFYTKDLRQAYRIKPTTLKRYLRDLNSYGLIKIISGSSARGYEYEMLETNEYAKLEESISISLEKSVLNIKNQWSSGPLVVHQ
ncbi:MAG: DNA primase, partial [Bacteroidetes bacterium]|nr:DNA primase [Bacteroidota bacterium]